VVASGGAGDLDHFAEALLEGGADAVLAASRLHDSRLTIREIKQYLRSKHLEVRL
jgi:cyclase